ncbi:MAG TPA: hypothetical protein VN962_26435, partial [Polyangia bacterium]|nr:hypothetical protein [Polyangia bacterium]
SVSKVEVKVKVITLLLAGLVAPSVAAAQPGGAEQVGIAVHPEAGFLLPLAGRTTGANSTPGIASLGLGVGYDVRPRIEVEATVSTTASASIATRDGGGRAVDQGTILRALVHWHARASGLSPLLGAGPALMLGGTFGTVPLLHLEGGVQLRARRGFYVAAAIQLVEPLMTSRTEIDPAQCVTADCPARFNPGDPIVGMRAALGFAF